jgi:U5 small nuclear ribonucleoprotein component
MVGGAIHHGKTSLLDMLVLETHQVAWDADKAVRLWYYHCYTS